MEDIFLKKKNVRPELLLDTSAIQKEALEPGVEEGEDIESSPSNSQCISVPKASFKRVGLRLYFKEGTFESMGRV
nr:unnamed protein product [Callosobruchus analis]